MSQLPMLTDDDLATISQMTAHHPRNIYRKLIYGLTQDQLMHLLHCAVTTGKVTLIKEILETKNYDVGWCDGMGGENMVQWAVNDKVKQLLIDAGFTEN